MSYVIAVVGAGGKSWYIDTLADMYAARGLKVCITTTTHIYNLNGRHNVEYRGKPEGVKLSYPGDDEYEAICSGYDVVLVEADGSRHCPVKIPAPYEPVIPSNANEIVIVMGHHACGRAISEVCQRFAEGVAADGLPPTHPSPSAASGAKHRKFTKLTPDTIIDGSIIDMIANEYYVKPLHEKFPNVKIKYFRNNLNASISEHAGTNIALVLMCSGRSERFGSSKLTYNLNGQELFRYGLEALITAKSLLAHDGIRSSVFVTGGNVELEHCVRTLYPDTGIIPNTLRHEGISGSVRCAAAMARDYNFDAILFLAGDMPLFLDEDIFRLTREFICSGKLYGCAYSSFPSNPAVFRRECYDDLLALSGDSGALKLIKQQPANVYYYVVSKKKLFDIDTPEDINSLVLS